MGLWDSMLCNGKKKKKHFINFFYFKIEFISSLVFSFEMISQKGAIIYQKRRIIIGGIEKKNERDNNLGVEFGLFDARI